VIQEIVAWIADLNHFSCNLSSGSYNLVHMTPPLTIRILLVAASIVAISLLHYLTPLHLHYLHDIFQRLYYLPIILAAIWFGFRGGLACSLVVSIVYAPHVLFQWGGQAIMELERYLEILLYNIVGGVTGLLAQRERERSIELEKTAKGLELSYKKLQEQSEQIIAIEKNLRGAEKLSTLGEMAAVLAHEIRNPLGSIRGTAEILRDDYKPGDPKYEFIDIQIKETERLNRVVEDFLHMAKPQSLEKVSCDIKAELETVVSLVAYDARQRKVALEIIASPGEMTISGDGDKLRQAFLNIVINALQATTSGGNIKIAINKSEAVIDISFIDSGSGVDPINLQRIFEPFFTTKPDGTGLGLAITKKIIEAHGGTLNIECPEEHGTAVLVTLPRGK
jgi:signal transduction histidine kinase